MKLKVHIETKWVGTSIEVELDTYEDFGFSDEEWDNLPSDQKEELIQDYAHNEIGFSFSFEEL